MRLPPVRVADFQMLHQLFVPPSPLTSRGVVRYALAREWWHSLRDVQEQTSVASGGRLAGKNLIRFIPLPLLFACVARERASLARSRAWGAEYNFDLSARAQIRRLTPYRGDGRGGAPQCPRAAEAVLHYALVISQDPGH